MKRAVEGISVSRMSGCPSNVAGMMRDERRFPFPKVPEVFLLFWVVKLLTTGIGEAGADYLGTVNLVLAGVVGIGGFLAALSVQLRATTYHPVRYWTTVLTVALFGT